MQAPIPVSGGIWIRIRVMLPLDLVMGMNMEQWVGMQCHEQHCIGSLTHPTPRFLFCGGDKHENIVGNLISAEKIFNYPWRRRLTWI